MIKKIDRKNMILNELDKLFEYPIYYDGSYDTYYENLLNEPDMNDVDCVRLCKVMDNFIRFRISYCPSKRENLGYKNFYLYSLGAQILIKKTFISFFDVVINNDIKNEVHKLYEHKLLEKYSSQQYMHVLMYSIPIDLIGQIIDVIKKDNPFFDYFTKFADRDSNFFIKQQGL